MRSLDRSNFKINKNTNNPTNLNYKAYGLHDVKTYDKGEIVKVEYYSTYSNDEYSDLVVDEIITYTKDELGFFKERNINVRWYLEDNNIGVEKVINKRFNEIESVLEGVNKRSNIIANCKSIIISEIKKTLNGSAVLVEAFTLLNSLKEEMSLYIDGNRQPLIDALSLREEEYIVSILSDLTSELSY